MTTPTIESPPAPQPRREASYAEPTEKIGAWRSLYWTGAIAALFIVLLTAGAVFVYVLWPPPSSMDAWFNLLQNNGIVGLLDLDLVMVVSAVLMIPVSLALYVTLRRDSPALSALGLALSLVGNAVLLSVNPAFSMLTLSNSYADATNATQRAAYLAAGQAVMANWTGSAFIVGYVLGGIATLLFAVVMLRSTAFTKITAYVGLATGLLMLVPASAGTVGLWVSLISLAPTVMWLMLIGMRFLMMGGPLGVEGAQFVVAHPRRRRT